MYSKIFLLHIAASLSLISFGAEQPIISSLKENPAVGICSIQNIRGSYKNQDRYIHTTVNQARLFFVFDGHGGDEVSDNLQNTFASSFSQLSDLSAENIKELYTAIDKNFATYPSGSTACGVCIKENRAYFITLGVSCAILNNLYG